MAFPEITFQWVGGATFILSTGNLKIACDPVLCPKNTLEGKPIGKVLKFNDDRIHILKPGDKKNFHRGEKTG